MSAVEELEIKIASVREDLAAAQREVAGLQPRWCVSSPLEKTKARGGAGAARQGGPLRRAAGAAHLDGPERAQAEREHLVELLAQAFVDRAAA